MTKIIVGDQSLTNDELLAKVGAGHISHDCYKEIIATHNALGSVQDVLVTKVTKSKNADPVKS